MRKNIKNLRCWVISAILCVVLILASQYTYASELTFSFKVTNGMITGLDENVTLEEDIILVIPYEIEMYNTSSTVKIIKGFNCEDQTSHYNHIVGLDLSQATDLKTISKSAFENCANLAGSITLPDGFEKVDDNAFAGTKIDTVYIENIYYDSENMLSISSTAFPETTNFVFKSASQREAFITQYASEWTNLEDRCKYKLHLIALNGTDQIDTEIEIMYASAIGENFDELINKLKSTLGDDFIGLSQNGSLITKDTLITSDTLTCEFQTVTQSTTLKTFEYGTTAVLAAESEGEYVWEGEEETSLSESNSLTLPMLSVGSYTYKCKVYENGSLKHIETFEVTITPAHTKITFSSESKTYTGSKIEVSFTSDKFSVDYFTATYYIQNSENGDYKQTDSVINAGSYKIEVTVKAEFSDNIIIDNDNSHTFNVDKYHLVANWGFENSVPYATIKANSINPLSDYATTELLKYNSETNEYERAVIGIGRWKAIITLKAEYEQNYVIANPEKQFEITATYVTITWVGADSYEYDGQEKQISYTIGGAENVDSHTTSDSTLAATNVGTYRIEVVIDDPNILPTDITALVYNWTINPKTLRVRWIESYMEYNGEPQAPSAYAEGANVRIVVNGAMTDANESNTNYTATATLETPNSNYILTNETFYFKIHKRHENIELVDRSITKDYDGKYVLPRYNYTGEMPVKFYVNGVETTNGVKDAGEHIVEIRIAETRNVQGFSETCLVRILPMSIKSETGGVTVEIDGKTGFDIDANINIDEIHNDKSFTLANVNNGGKLALAKMIKISIDANPEETPTIKGIKFKIKNINTDGLRIFSVTPDGLVECEYKIENGYICIANAGTGTFAFLTKKPTWFQSVGVWVLSVACGLAVLAIVIVSIARKPINEKLERQVVKAMSKAYEEQYQEHLEKQKALEEKSKEESSVEPITSKDDDMIDEDIENDDDIQEDLSEEDDFNNFHDND